MQPSDAKKCTTNFWAPRMRPSSVVAITQTARAASKQFVRIQLKESVERLGAAGDIVLVRPGHMRNHLFPKDKASYLPLETPAQRAKRLVNEGRVEVEQASRQEQERQIAETTAKQQSLHQELGPVQLLSLRAKLERIPPITFTRRTTTNFDGKAGEIPNPPLTIQGSISVQDIVNFLRSAGFFTLETQFSPDSTFQTAIPLNELTNAQIFTVCDLTLTVAEGITGGSIDKSNRIKSTGRYELTILLNSSNTRVRIPLTVHPLPSSSSSAADAGLPSASTSAPSSLPGQTRGYATQAHSSPRMESSMRHKLEAEYGPAEITIRNDSSKHAHHAAMAAQGGGNGETHFFVEVISDKFNGMTQLKRHRAVNALLAHEFELGLHALSLKLKTFAEVDKAAPSTATLEQNAKDDDALSFEEALKAEEQAAQRARDQDILEAFYTAPPKGVPRLYTARRDEYADAHDRPVTDAERERYFRRVTRNEAVLPTHWQNIANLIGGLLAAGGATYMVLFADFDQHAITNPSKGGRKENCFTPIREFVFGPTPPSPQT